MIYSYGTTQQGAYHVKTGTPCQDAHLFRKINDRFSVGAVADGLGSQQFTDVASALAVETAVESCAEKIDELTEPEEILSVIRESFSQALRTIEERAEADGNPPDQYDTTLTLAVYREGTVYFGHSGDSGIVVQNIDGTYEPITEQQRDENGCVFPLSFGESYWVFGTKENVASVLLATDGIYETLFPYLLCGEDVNIYVALANFLMSNESLGFTPENSDEISKKMSAFIANIPGEQVSDDKTALVMLDDSVAAARQPEEYYQVPDWAALKQKRDEEYKRKAYPHLYDNEEQNDGE